MGRVGFITKEIEENGFVFANFIQRIAVHNVIDAKYLFFCLQQMYEMGITACMQSQTTGIRNLDWKLYTKTVLPKPPQPEQHAIASILSKVAESIQASKDTIAKAERLKKALMQNLLTGRLRPDGTWRKEEDFYTDEKFGKVPKGWKIKRVDNVFEVNEATLSAKTDPDYIFNYITIEAVSTEKIDYSAIIRHKFKNSPSRARRILKEGDTIVSTVRPNLKAFTIFQKPNNEEWICSTGFGVLSPKERQDTHFYFYQLLGDIGEKQFHSLVAGSNYPAISDRDLRRIKLLEAPYEEQVEIGTQIKKLSKFESSKQTKIQKLERLKKALMQNLLTGKVRVKIEK